MGLRYLAMNLVFMTLAMGIFLLIKPQLSRRSLLISGLCMFGCMLIFNTYLTSLPIVRYNTSNILGLKVSTMPVEDFAYLVVAIFLGPGLFNYYRAKEK